MHHVAARRWFARRRHDGWLTCPITESGFVRVSSNPKALPSAIAVADARRVLVALRAVSGHRFVPDDVSLADSDVPVMTGHRQVTDVHLLTLARRSGAVIATFDGGLAELGGSDVELLRA
jgi:toxin-antitoxin system PIN domain toxin